MVAFWNESFPEDSIDLLDSYQTLIVTCSISNGSFVCWRRKQPTKGLLKQVVGYFILCASRLGDGIPVVPVVSFN